MEMITLIHVHGNLTIKFNINLNLKRKRLKLSNLMASTASMTTQYFEYQRDLENRYGHKSIVLWMCGSFYETYGLYSGKDKISPLIQHSIDYQIGNIEEISKIIGNAMTKRFKRTRSYD